MKCRVSVNNNPIIKYSKAHHKDQGSEIIPTCLRGIANKAYKIIEYSLGVCFPNKYMLKYLV